MGRPDAASEAIRRNNAAARTHPASIYLVGLSDQSENAMIKQFGQDVLPRIRRIRSQEELKELRNERKVQNNRVVRWGRDRIGVGLMHALLSKSDITFSDEPSPSDSVPQLSRHLVVCEEGDPLSEVIAANYAYSLNAGFHLIGETDDELSKQVLESFYSIYERRDVSQSDAIDSLVTQLKQLCGPLPVPDRGSITFIARRLPFGFAFPEHPSTHLFKYPDLGISIINGFSQEQSSSRGLGIAVLVDPETTPATEMDAAKVALLKKGVMVRSLKGRLATVREVTETIELLPYDLLVIATHCGDVSGSRWTYKFTDSHGIERTLEVDVGIGIAHTDDSDLFTVTQYTRFVSLDGVDWSDPEKLKKLEVGTAMEDFIEMTRGKGVEALQPVKKEPIGRVVGSAALKMYDQDYLAMPRSLADEGAPVIVNNACSSWHELAKRFTFANARGYVGTLFPVTNAEASEFVVKLFEGSPGDDLPRLVWAAQNDVYGKGRRRPYVVAGVFPQSLRISRSDISHPNYLLSRLVRAQRNWRAKLRKIDQTDEFLTQSISEILRFYAAEIQRVNELVKARPGSRG